MNIGVMSNPTPPFDAQEQALSNGRARFLVRLIFKFKFIIQYTTISAIVN